MMESVGEHKVKLWMSITNGSEMSGLSEALSFFTILPAGQSNDMSKRILNYFALTGAIIGSISGLVFYIVRIIFPGLVAATVSVSVILLITGFTHLDGVMDSGDALMVRGSPERRAAVLKDRFTGAGAFGLAMIIYIPLIAFLSVFTPFQGFLAILFSEIISKVSYLLMLNGARTINEGLAHHFASLMSISGGRAFLINILIFLIIAATLYPVSVALLPAAVIITYLARRKFYSLFNGINGDLLALNGEVTRLAAVILMALLSLYVTALPSLASLLLRLT